MEKYNQFNHQRCILSDQLIFNPNPKSVELLWYDFVGQIIDMLVVVCYLNDMHSPLPISFFHLSLDRTTILVLSLHHPLST